MKVDLTQAQVKLLDLLLGLDLRAMGMSPAQEKTAYAIRKKIKQDEVEVVALAMARAKSVLSTPRYRDQIG